MRITYRPLSLIAAALVLSWSIGPVSIAVAQPSPKEQCLAQMAMLKKVCEQNCAEQGGGAQCPGTCEAQFASMTRLCGEAPSVGPAGSMPPGGGGTTTQAPVSGKPIGTRPMKLTAHYSKEESSSVPRRSDATYESYASEGRSTLELSLAAGFEVPDIDFAKGFQFFSVSRHQIIGPDYVEASDGSRRTLPPTKLVSLSGTESYTATSKSHLKPIMSEECLDTLETHGTGQLAAGEGILFIAVGNGRAMMSFHGTPFAVMGEATSNCSDHRQGAVKGEQKVDAFFLDPKMYVMQGESGLRQGCSVKVTAKRASYVGTVACKPSKSGGKKVLETLSFELSF